MENTKSSIEERKIKLIKEIESNFDFGIKDAVEYNGTVETVIDSVLKDCKVLCADDIDHWLENHYDDLESYIKEGYLNGCPAFIEVINRVNSDIVSEELHFLEDKIQELLDLVWGPEEDDA